MKSSLRATLFPFYALPVVIIVGAIIVTTKTTNSVGQLTFLKQSAETLFDQFGLFMLGFLRSNIGMGAAIGSFGLLLIAFVIKD